MRSSISLVLHCLYCEKLIKGRMGKKFCDDWCRNAYHNKLNSEFTSPLIRTINSILKRNRKILGLLLPAGKETAHASKKKLQDMGFNFGYFTHQVITKKGQTYVFCYEYGYLLLESDFYLIVARNKKRDLEAG
ncbi:MAG: hypothetical protein ACTHMM_19305 [Agriterribacter sp.]